MKKTKISIIVTSFILLVSMMFTMVSCTTGKTPSTDDESEAFVETTALSTHFVNTENVKLMAASPMMMNPKAATITQKITATVCNNAVPSKFNVAPNGSTKLEIL